MSNSEWHYDQTEGERLLRIAEEHRKRDADALAAADALADAVADALDVGVTGETAAALRAYRAARGR